MFGHESGPALLCALLHALVSNIIYIIMHGYWVLYKLYIVVSDSILYTMLPRATFVWINNKFDWQCYKH